ncbi:KptA family-domain-containing protein [Schizophyllum amplum]|uniref:2'-phosphotransferase n=1 Tax=Schizophyllum amplum TaxID=97359 RepID=A0A550CKW6_9AGAR|nr:KptA family-domain-containing protein [Auriculariopsis ampla]
MTEPATAFTPRQANTTASSIASERGGGKGKQRGGRGRGGGRGGGGGGGSSKLRGLEKDSPTVRLSKTLSYILRHGAQKEGIPIRPDGYVKVDDLMKNNRLKSQSLTLETLQQIVKDDAKQRYDLVLEEPSTWLIKARQGHSIQEVKLELKPILSSADIPTGIAVHGTMNDAWNAISKQGLSKMKRNHIHLAQGVGGDNVISGMRKSCQVFIYVDVDRAIAAGIRFFLSDNGVVLTEGDEQGHLPRKFFSKVEDAKGHPLSGRMEQ